MYRVRPLFVLVTLITGLALGASGGTPALGAGCTGIPLLPADNIAARINADLGTAATTFCLAAGTYNVAATIQLGPGDKLIGPTGAITTRGPASYGTPTARIHGSSGLQPVIRLTANNTTISWLDISGGRVGIGAAKAGNGSVIEYSAIHDTAQAGIGAMSGSLMHSQLFNNSTDKTTWGDTAGAVKGTKEYQAAFNYVHDNFGNGIWCDYGCRDTGMPNGYWVHNNLVVNNGRWGVRYEYSPAVNPGVRVGNPTALIENNSIHGNGTQTSGTYGGASMWDAQNATFRNNTFGAATISGVSYKADVHNLAILFFASGKRTDLWHGVANSNTLKSEQITGCNLADSIVACSGNS